jgi:spectrin beta
MGSFFYSYCHVNGTNFIFCRFDEKGNLEIMLFTIQSKMRAHNQKPYLPKEGKLISDINKAWDRLEKSEHERELSLREELIR